MGAPRDMGVALAGNAGYSKAGMLQGGASSIRCSPGALPGADIAYGRAYPVTVPVLLSLI